nr:33 kda Ca(2+)-dependent carbohydrate-binding protein, p33=annexin IV homolog {internal fragment 33L-18} [cattle, kidney, Peptide Partial, 16 aa] [Bos taurus]
AAYGFNAAEDAQTLRK